ncbi:MAG: Glu/Leu/Phe/Val dehydrogenase [Deltaproteobacteria bacterium]|uniref:Glutamate dehydrogenase n=1 Tax=Candidatus Zymogenus saltonus TaxID=2844893 RepID=A0A9D8KHS1_9DELT|nr:Glu/Leu/Phe/Val dehydrogenase [Candidatus Zymogenus saltonus]
MMLDEKYMYETTLYDPESGVTAFIVIDRLLNGVSGGGVRMSPGVTLAEVGMLARTMTYKFAAVGVRVGGAKSGILLDPRSPDKTKAVASFGRMAEPFLKTIYMIGEDMGTTAKDLTLIYEEAGINPIAFAKAKAKELGITLDIPEEVELSSLGGESFEEIITGYGLCEAAEEAVGRYGMELKSSTVSLQGFGTVGSISARNLARRGARVIAVTDIEGTILNKDGLDVEKLIEAKDNAGTIDRKMLDFEFTAGGGDGWLTAGADIIVPAAVAGAINEKNVKVVDAKLILEGANIPITEGAQKALTKRGVPIIPDFIANAGAAAGFGLILTGECKIEEVFGEFSRRIRSGVTHCIEESRKSGITTREAAINLALKNLSED